MSLDFAGLSAYLRSRTREFLPTWLPGGKLMGAEYECANLSGGRGKSLRVNINTNLWSDFSTGDKGGDLISLYAAIERIDNGAAFKKLADIYHFGGPTNGAAGNPAPALIPPPRDHSQPKSFTLVLDRKPTEPSKIWQYMDREGKLLFHVARYETPAGKEFRPWSWSTESLWVAKAWPNARPLYGLEFLKHNKPVLIVEGEKAADAARSLVSVYNVITWMSGAKAVTKTDWRPLYGKKILLWPDADRKRVGPADRGYLERGFKVGDIKPYEDQPGPRAMIQIAEILYAHCPEIKIINVQDVETDGWDAADAVQDGWDFKKFRTWAVPRVKMLKPVSATPFVAPIPPMDTKEIVTTRRAPGPQFIDPPPIPTRTRSTENEPPAITIVQDAVPKNISHFALWTAAGVIVTKQGSPIVNVDSVLKLLRHFPQFKNIVWWDEFHCKIFTTWGGTQPREWRETDEINIAAYFQSELGMTKVNDDLIRKAIYSFAEANVRNEPRDWMSSLKWDGKERIETFFIDTMGAADSEYTRAVSKNFWVSIAARIFSPGCKVDTMIILESGQGKMKSTALEIIGGKWFAETNESPTNKDFFLLMQGKLILEVAELDAFSKADFKTIKKVLSCKVDNFRPPFGRYTKAFSRQSVFCGTTNEDEYLEDPTGGRRFMPFQVHNIDLEKIRRDREQLFAEAVAKFEQGASWWVVPRSARDEQENRRQSDPWEPTVHEWCQGKLVVDVQSIATSALKMDMSDLTHAIKIRIGKILRVQGMKNVPHREGNSVRRLWMRPQGPDLD